MILFNESRWKCKQSWTICQSIFPARWDGSAKLSSQNCLPRGKIVRQICPVYEGLNNVLFLFRDVAESVMPTTTLLTSPAQSEAATLVMALAGARPTLSLAAVNPGGVMAEAAAITEAPIATPAEAEELQHEQMVDFDELMRLWNEREAEKAANKVTEDAASSSSFSTVTFGARGDSWGKAVRTNKSSSNDGVSIEVYSFSSPPLSILRNNSLQDQ